MPRTPKEPRQAEQVAGAEPVAELVEQAQELAITIDRQALKLPDLKFLSRWRRGDVTDDEVVDFLARIVVGGIDELPLDALDAVIYAVFNEVYGGKQRKN